MNLFGTDGIRGIANEDLTCEIAFRLGQTVGMHLSSKEKVCIGKDTRVSGDMLEASLVAGITSTGRDVIRLGVITTPGLSFIVSRYGLGGGVMISASHNLFEYNGLKVFGPDGRKISDDMEIKFSRIILSRNANWRFPTGNGIGKVIDGCELVHGYVEFLTQVPKVDFSGLKVLVDAANGSSADLAMKVWEPLCPQTGFINCSPDGLNINKNCGSTNPQYLASKVVKGKFNVGFAYDGDGDRCIAVDEQGNVLSGDHIMAIMALDMAEHGCLQKSTVVGTVMANLGLEKCLCSRGITLLRTPVGDRFVLEEMDRGGYILGGEQSGHIIFGHILPAGDGMLTSLLLAEVVAKTGRSLSELASVLEQIPQSLVNVKAKCPGRVVTLPSVQQAIEEAGKGLAGRGRVLVRASGTEPVVRIMVESHDNKLVDECVKYLKSVIIEESNK